jgi:hypothetical protein
MTEEQKEIIRNYNFPKFYSFFYKIWKKYLSTVIVSLFLIIFVLMIIYNNSNWDGFNFIRGIVFGVFSLGLLTLSAYLTKEIYLRFYLKKVGMSLTEWNSLTKGLTIDDIKKI